MCWDERVLEQSKKTRSAPTLTGIDLETGVAVSRLNVLGYACLGLGSVCAPKPPPPIAKSFTRAGSRTSSRKSVPRKKSLLDTAQDWKLLVDFERQKLVFPPEIYGTSERPDIVIWSVSTRTVIRGSPTPQSLCTGCGSLFLQHLPVPQKRALGQAA